jgi:hypothetical protein
MLAMPMSEIPEKIPLDSETKALLRGENSLLRPIYQRASIDSPSIGPVKSPSSVIEAVPTFLSQNFRQCPVVQNLSVLPLACLQPDEYH